MITFPHTRKLFLFAALNAADLALTWLLLERGGGRAYESNPVAWGWLAGFGWPGLVGFKLSIVVLVAALTVVVSRHRPRAGGRILAFGCSALTAVILYSGLLLCSTNADAAEVRQVEELSDRWDDELVRQRAYWALLGRLRDGLIARRDTLAEATEALAATEFVQDPNWLKRMEAQYPGRSARECVAARLVESTLSSTRADAHESRQLALELDAQFRSCFGRPAPSLQDGDR